MIDTNKRQLVKSVAKATATAAIGTAVFPTVFAKNTKHEVLYVASWPDFFPFMDSIKQSVEEIHRVSEGEIHITLVGGGGTLPNGEKFNPFNVWSDVSKGDAHMGNTAAYYFQSISNINALFTSFPFGMSTEQFFVWWQHGAGQWYNQWLTDNHGMVATLGMSTGSQPGGWFDRPINSVEDLKGLKIRVPGMGGRVLKSLGAEVVSLPGSKLPSALKNKEINATEWVGPYLDQLMGFDQLMPYYYISGWHEPGGALMNLMNKEWFASLSERHQLMINSSLRSSQVLMGSLDFTAKNIKAFNQIKAADKVSIKTFPESVMKALEQASNKMFDEMMSADQATEEIFKNYRSFMENSEAYFNLTEDNFRCRR